MKNGQFERMLAVARERLSRHAPEEIAEKAGRLLFDESAPKYLTIEDAVTVGSLILDCLTGAQHWAV